MLVLYPSFSCILLLHWKWCHATKEVLKTCYLASEFFQIFALLLTCWIVDLSLGGGLLLLSLLSFHVTQSLLHDIISVAGLLPLLIENIASFNKLSLSLSLSLYAVLLVLTKEGIRLLFSCVGAGLLQLLIEHIVS